jgi:hypothetical protein
MNIKLLGPEGAARQLYKEGEVEYNPYQKGTEEYDRFISEMDQLTREELNEFTGGANV